jgi:hypothetical protein
MGIPDLVIGADGYFVFKAVDKRSSERNGGLSTAIVNGA